MEIFKGIFCILFGMVFIGAVVYERIMERVRGNVSINGTILDVDYGEETVLKIGYKYDGFEYECYLHEGMQVMNHDTKTGGKVVVYIRRNNPDIPLNIYRMTKYLSGKAVKGGKAWSVGTTCLKIILTFLFGGALFILFGCAIIFLP